MEWIKIDPDNLPKEEVLASCFDCDNEFQYKCKVVGVLQTSWIKQGRLVHFNFNNGSEYVPCVTCYGLTKEGLNEIDYLMPTHYAIIPDDLVC